jgi:hypothetical protein
MMTNNTWDKALENKITSILSAVTQDITKNISNLTSRVEELARERANNMVQQQITSHTPPTHTVPPLMSINSAEVEARIQRREWPRLGWMGEGQRRGEGQEGMEGGRRPRERELLAGPARARPYQPRTQTTQGGKSTKQPPPKQNTTTPRDDTHSSNPDMQKLIKSVHKLVSLQHHSHNWTTTPPSIVKNIDRITSSIKPPLCDDKFQSSVKELGEKFAREISSLIHDHLDDKGCEIERQIRAYNPADKNIIDSIVIKQFAKKQGNKFNDTKIKQYLAHASNLIGRAYVQSGPAANTSNHGIPTHNRFDAIAVADETDPEDDPESEDESHRETHPPATTTAQNPPSLLPPSVTPPAPNTSPLPGPSTSSPPRPTTNINQPHCSTQPSTNHSGHTLRNRKIFNPRPTPDYAELKNHNIFIYPNKTKPVVSELEGIPHRQAQVLIIGDSNLQFVRNLPENWELLSISGLKVEGAMSILTDLPEPLEDDPLKHVILAVGLNDRHSCKPPLADCVRAAAGLKHKRRRVSFLEVVDPGSARTKEPHTSVNIQRLNQAARSSTEVNFIPAPTRVTYDGAGYHFDESYTCEIIQCLESNIFSLN